MNDADDVIVCASCSGSGRNYEPCIQCVEQSDTGVYYCMAPGLVNHPDVGDCEYCKGTGVRK